jgi:hypothetical protein
MLEVDEAADRQPVLVVLALVDHSVTSRGTRLPSWHCFSGDGTDPPRRQSQMRPCGVTPAWPHLFGPLTLSAAVGTNWEN